MIAWLALALALLNLLIFVALIVGVRGLVARYKPTLEPLLSMFAPPPHGAEPVGGDSSTGGASPPAEPR